jgi:hypothetical protein
MNLVVQVKSYADRPIELALPLELPSKPIDAKDGNSKWKDDSGYLRNIEGYCVAGKTKAAFPDTLFLYQLTPPEGDPKDSRVPKATRRIIVTLLGFFGSDGGIRERGEGTANRTVATSERLLSFAWWIEAPQVYPKSVTGP